MYSNLFTRLALLFFICTTANATGLVLLEETQKVDLLKHGTLFKSDPSVSIERVLQNADLEPFLIPAEHIHLQPGVYWLNGKIKINSQNREFIFDPANSLIDRVDLVLFSPEDTIQKHTGYLARHDYHLHYAKDLILKPGTEYEYWIRMESRYFPVIPELFLAPRDVHSLHLLKENLIIICCLGALIVLALYNLFIYIWSKETSYLYYSVFLLVSSAGWSAVFNIPQEILGWFALDLIFVPFYLNIATNCLFFISFLGLSKHQLAMTGLTKALIFVSVTLSLCQFLIPPWINYLLINLFTGLWLTTGLISGILRYRDGYKPARFFILAFSVMSVGGLFTVLPSLGFAYLIHNTYLSTLVLQTCDAILLALALADRINLLREQKTRAMLLAKEADERANRSLSEANEKLSYANETLSEALAISEQEKKRKDEFILTVSHELKTPLNAISASLDNLSIQASSSDQKNLDFIRHGTDRLNAQVQNIVMLAETDRREISKRDAPFSLEHLIDRIRQIAESSLVQKDVEVLIKIEDDLPEHFIGDFYLISHMLVPIMENACRYTEKGEVIFSTEAYPGGLKFTLADTGPGIEESKQRMIFEAFSQISTGFDRNNQGLGLGLTVTKRLVDILNGELELHSVPGTGTMFTIRIPLRVPDEFKNNTRFIDIAGHALIVEDNIVNARVLQGILRKLGITSEIAGNGEIAVQIFTPGHFDLVLMDLQMPVMDGFKATELIRQKDPLVPIIAVTANTDYQARLTCVEKGMNEIIEKPVRRNDIEKVLMQFYQLDDAVTTT